MGWNQDASGFHAYLLRMHRDMGLPIIVTENGAAYRDTVDVDGHVLWGMTLRLLDQLVPRLLAGEWEV